MSGEKHLATLLSELSPQLLDREYVFCSYEGTEYGDYASLTPLVMVKEFEGLTLVIPRTRADEHEIRYELVFRCITLNVHSSLDAVGLTAALSSKLAQKRISANVIAGFFHDHVFVPAEVVEESMSAIRELTPNK